MLQINDKINKFLIDLQTVNPERVHLVNKLREIYLSSYPNLSEKFIYGGIGIYHEDNLIGGIWVYTKHVSVIFSNGYKLKGSNKILEGGGKFRRHIKITSEEDIEDKEVIKYIEKYVDLELG